MLCKKKSIKVCMPLRIFIMWKIVIWHLNFGFWPNEPREIEIHNSMINEQDWQKKAWLPSIKISLQRAILRMRISTRLINHLLNHHKSQVQFIVEDRSAKVFQEFHKNWFECSGDKYSPKPEMPNLVGASRCGLLHISS